MRAIPLGVGGAFSRRFYHTNYLVELPGKNLLVDAGTTLRYSMLAAGYADTDIHAVALTHFHSDHYGGLEEFAQRCRYVHRCRPAVYVRPDQEELLERLFSLHGVAPDFYFDVMPAAQREVVDEAPEGAYLLEYFPTEGLHAQVTSNYMIGVRYVPDRGAGVRVLFSGDIGPIERSALPALADDPETAAIFHDCSLAPAVTDAHPTLDQMAAVYPPAVRHKIHIIHYGDDILEHERRITGLGFKIAQQGEAVVVGPLEP